MRHYLSNTSLLSFIFCPVSKGFFYPIPEQAVRPEILFLFLIKKKEYGH